MTDFHRARTTQTTWRAGESGPDRTRVDHDLRHLGHPTDKGVVGRPFDADRPTLVL
jgi:hypothetical protein